MPNEELEFSQENTDWCQNFLTEILCLFHSVSSKHQGTDLELQNQLLTLKYLVDLCLPKKLLEKKPSQNKPNLFIITPSILHSFKSKHRDISVCMNDINERLIQAKIAKMKPDALILDLSSLGLTRFTESALNEIPENINVLILDRNPLRHLPSFKRLRSLTQLHIRQTEIPLESLNKKLPEGCIIHSDLGQFKVSKKVKNR